VERRQASASRRTRAAPSPLSSAQARRMKVGARRLEIRVCRRSASLSFCGLDEPTGPARSGRPDDRLREIRERVEKSWRRSRISLALHPGCDVSITRARIAPRECFVLDWSVTLRCSAPYEAQSAYAWARCAEPRMATARAAYPSRAAEPVIGPATPGRPRWRPPQDDDSRASRTPAAAGRSPRPRSAGKQKRARRIALTGVALSCHVARP
jgi:hypothetical protein